MKQIIAAMLITMGMVASGLGQTVTTGTYNLNAPETEFGPSASPPPFGWQVTVKMVGQFSGTHRVGIATDGHTPIVICEPPQGAHCAIPPQNWKYIMLTTFSGDCCCGTEIFSVNFQLIEEILPDVWITRQSLNLANEIPPWFCSQPVPQVGRTRVVIDPLCGGECCP